MPNQLLFQHLRRKSPPANTQNRHSSREKLLPCEIIAKKCPWLFCAFSFNEICRFCTSTNNETQITDHTKYRSCWDPERDHFQFSFFHFFHLHSFCIRRRVDESFDAWPRAMNTLHCYYLCIVLTARWRCNYGRKSSRPCRRHVVFQRGRWVSALIQGSNVKTIKHKQCFSLMRENVFGSCLTCMGTSTKRSCRLIKWCVPASLQLCDFMISEIMTAIKHFFKRVIEYWVGALFAVLFKQRKPVSEFNFSLLLIIIFSQELTRRKHDVLRWRDGAQK